MEIKAGYKQTEIGVIPEDWDLRFFGEMASVRKQTYDSRKSGAHDFCVELEHIGQGTGTLLGYSETSMRSSMKRVFNKNDVLFGRLRAYLRKYWLANKPGVASSEIWPLVANPDVTISEYVFQIVQTNDFIDAASETYGTHMPRSDWNIIKTLRVPVPRTKVEQSAIAEALSDADKLIASLEKLIAKKKYIKQGAMQVLLPGKKRLPGFTGEWETTTLGDIAYIGRGRVISHREINASIFSQYPVYSSQTLNDGIMGYIDTYDFDGEYITWTTDGVNAGTPFYRKGKFNCTNVCGTIKLKSDNHQFIAYLLEREMPKYVSRNLANPKLMNDVAKRVEIRVPKLINEQATIAQVLSDMDTEIEELGNKLSKYKLIKQGMMQELLTGKRRLV